MKIDESISFLDDSTKNIISDKIKYLANRISTLEYVILFGSFARMEQTIKSDIDLLAISAGVPDRLLRGDLCSEFEEQNIDLFFYDLDIFRKSNCLFTSQIKNEGIILWRRN